MTNENGSPQGNTGDIVNWPMLKVVYRTDPKCISALLPPGIQPGSDPHVNITIYNFPVPDEPEYGIVTTINADYEGKSGEYTLGYGIDQESAIFISQETNGQPKYPCTTEYYRLGPMVSARCIHQGYTFVEFKGMSKGPVDLLPEFDQHEWWIKSSRAVSVGGPASGFDFPPHVVHVQSRYGTAWREEVEGKLLLRDSPWDPLTTFIAHAGASLCSSLVAHFSRSQNHSGGAHWIRMGSCLLQIQFPAHVILEQMVDLREPSWSQCKRGVGNAHAKLSI